MSLSISLNEEKAKGPDEDSIRYSAGEVIYLEGEPSNFLYIIRRGKIRVVKESDNRLVPISMLKEKEFLGEIGIFDNSERKSTAITIEDSELVKINRKQIETQVKNFPEWVMKIMLTLSERLQGVEEMLTDHKITSDDSLNEGNYLSNEEEFRLKEIIKIYRLSLKKSK